MTIYKLIMLNYVQAVMRGPFRKVRNVGSCINYRLVGAVCYFAFLSCVISCMSEAWRSFSLCKPSGRPTCG